MLENQGGDIIGEGEALLEKYEFSSPNPEDQNQISEIKALIGLLKVEFDDHFKNRITMLCHVPKLDITNEKESSTGEISPSFKQPVVVEQPPQENQMSSEKEK